MTDLLIRDFELAQQLAQQYTDHDEIERQRRIQIEAYLPLSQHPCHLSLYFIADSRYSDEEFARQVQAAMSPVQQQSHRFGSTQNTDSPEMTNDDIFTPSHSPDMPFASSAFENYNASQASPPQASTALSSFTLPSHASSSADLTFPRCFLPRTPADTTCWRCLTSFTTPAASDVST